MKKPIKLGMVGIGRAGFNMHLKEMAGKEDMFSIVAACDVEAERRETMAEKFGCKTYYKIEDIVSDPDVEVIDIATRSNDHFVHAKTALEAGKIVFLEKPMAMTYEEAKKLVEINEKLGGDRLYVRHNRRFEAKFMQVNKIIESGILGKVYYIKRSVGNFDYRSDWQTLSQYGGGQLLNWGPHLVDQALCFSGGDYKRMFAVTKHAVAAGDCEDVVKASFVGINDVNVEISISGAEAIRPPEYIVCGTRGELIDIDGTNFKIKYISEDFADPDLVASINTPMGTGFGGKIKPTFVEEERAWEENPLDHTWTYLYSAVREGKAYPVSCAEALKVMQTIQDIKDQNK